MNMLYQDVTCKYELELRDGALILNICPQIMADLTSFTESNPYVKSFITNLGLSKFIRFQSDECGFDESVSQVCQDPFGWSSLRFNLPRIDHGDAEGWKKAYAISATLSLIFAVVNVFDYDQPISHASKHQLLAIWPLNAMNGQHGSAFNAHVSPQMCRWLAAKISPKNTVTDLPCALVAMKDAYRRMWPTVHSSVFSEFRAYIKPPYLIRLNCPGNASGLGVSYFEPDEGGYSLDCGNIDNPMQQITLLVGLAKIHDMARKDGY